ncbi:MAG: serine/threonine protein kinase [Prevotella sp.]|nr:serine/threonine protein kinase [Prevotella sp.]
MASSGKSVSGYLTTDYEGISTTFTDISAMPSKGHCCLYRAKRYGRYFLLKCLKPELCAEPVYQQMLRKEFEILMRLQHPAILQAVNFEPVMLPDREDAAVCIVTEWIDGDTLDDFLTTHPTLAERRHIATELAEALAYIHSQQVVHRDLKPSNIMVTHNGHYLKVIDFGLADTDSHAILKQPAGTLKYMSPEQAQQAIPDVRNDIYSLGIIFQEMELGGG